MRAVARAAESGVVAQAALSALTRGRPAGQLERMDEVAGARIIDVDLPRTPAPQPSSRTARGELHPAFRRRYSEPAYPLRVAALPGGQLVGSGGVLSSDGRLVRESLWDEEHFRRDFERPRRRGRPTRLRGIHASLISLWHSNYFHWVFNSLPRLALLALSGIELDGYIVPEQLAPFQAAQLDLLGITKSKRVPFVGEHVQADTLVWAAPLAPINEPSGYLIDWVRKRFCPDPPEPWRRLYVSRRGTRVAANERELYAALEPLGFEYVLPETLPFSEQVALFASTRLAVGPHGSNFVNCVFSRHMSVLELFQPEHVNWGVYSVLCAAGHDHWNIICPRVHRFGRPRRFDDMRVPVELVLDAIAGIEARVPTL